jgi:hypothetical protein
MAEINAVSMLVSFPISINNPTIMLPKSNSSVPSVSAIFRTFSLASVSRLGPLGHHDVNIWLQGFPLPPMQLSHAVTTMHADTGETRLRRNIRSG